MQHPHATRKENAMNMLTLEELRAHPRMLALIEARARRARSEAVAGLVGRLARAVVSHFAPRPDERRCASRAS
jgi:hypothetical protein